jgi:hypothetical protein
LRQAWEAGLFIPLIRGLGFGSSYVVHRLQPGNEKGTSNLAGRDSGRYWLLVGSGVSAGPFGVSLSAAK